MQIFSNTNKLFYVLVALIVLVVFFTVILILKNLGGGGESVTLEFWGVFDEKRVFERVFQEFRREYPNIDVRYTKMSFEDYETKSINSFASGTGPDVWMIHNTWLPKHGSKLKAMPSKISGYKTDLMTASQFKNQFVDVAYKDLVYNDQIYAMPIYMDTLAMFYNKEIFNTAGITQPATSWDQFNNQVEQLTKADVDGNLLRAGAALGTARNINRSTDILMALMLQSGVQMTDKTNTGATFSRSVSGQQVGEIALEYYTDFANPQKRTYTWNDSQHYSIDAFTNGQVGIMFNYSHQIPVLKEKATRFDFGIAALPQLDEDEFVNFANYWAPAVPATSKHTNEAWLFINYLASNPGALAYLTEAQRPAARRDIIETQKADGDLGVFARQALSAESWYQVDNTAIEKIFADMIEDINFKRRKVDDALRNAESRVNVLMVRSRDN